jgi:tRNA-splicing ligase RtcB
MKIVLKENDNRPIKIWTDYVEPEAAQQLRNLSTLPFVAKNGIAVMPDVHAGKGSTVGTVIATRKVIIPAAVGVDIGCGMNAVRLNLKASDLPDSLRDIRLQIERDVPLGAGGAHPDGRQPQISTMTGFLPDYVVQALFKGDSEKARKKYALQLGTLGSGNHFIELCLDESDQVWIMLHSGSRGIGNMIGSHYIEIAKREMEKWHISLPDQDLAYLPEGSKYFNDYMGAVQWAQSYAYDNRRAMMGAVILAMRRHLPDLTIEVTSEAINCHHNYVALEHHFGQNLWVTRKGAIRARECDMGIIPGARGARSYIVRGKGNPESYHSCSHGAGRKMSRSQARKSFSVEDLKKSSEGIECAVTSGLVDEIAGAYKDIDTVMENQKDLVEIVHTLRAVMNVKGE